MSSRIISFTFKTASTATRSRRPLLRYTTMCLPSSFASVSTPLFLPTNTERALATRRLSTSLSRNAIVGFNIRSPRNNLSRYSNLRELPAHFSTSDIMTMTMYPDFGVLNVSVFTGCCVAAAVFSIKDKLKQKSKKTQSKDSMTTEEDKEKRAVALRKQQEERITKNSQYQETDRAEPLESLGVKIEINFLGPKKKQD